MIGREAYAWHPDGIQKSKLARELGKRLRGDGTARNWNTVTKLLELARTVRRRERTSTAAG